MILKLLERTASYIPSFEEVGEAVRDALVQERASELARQKADALLVEVKAGKSLQELAGALNMPVDQTGFFSRNSGIPKLGRPMDFIKEAFQMTLRNGALTCADRRRTAARFPSIRTCWLHSRMVAMIPPHLTGPSVDA